MMIFARIATVALLVLGAVMFVVNVISALVGDDPIGHVFAAVLLLMSGAFCFVMWRRYERSVKRS